MSDLTVNGIIKDISPNDEMFAGDKDHYFGVGQSALECILCSLNAARVPVDQIRHILDLPCGHGRVLRYIKAAFPRSEITAGDLLRDGVDYCARTFGAIPLYSDEDPVKITLEPNTFDLIWVGSLLTHLKSKRWSDFLKLFCRCLRPGGVLVFSAHGREARERTAEGKFNYGLPSWRTTAVLYGYERSGFGYANFLNSNSYGHSLSHPAWVLKEIAGIGEMRVVHFAERAWDRHHDIYACLHDPSWRIQRSTTAIITFLKHKIREQAILRVPWLVRPKENTGSTGSAASR